MNTQIKYTLLIVGLLLLTVLLTACHHGDKGLTGLPGATIPVLAAPASLLQCANGGTVVTIGSSVNIICNGVQGPSGAPGQDSTVPGPKGDIGSPGINATPISVVTFCPGVTIYPSAFLEVGLIIGGRLYGVYSKNDGFLAELPPGRYESNAVGSSCDFTINADLSISY